MSSKKMLASHRIVDGQTGKLDYDSAGNKKKKSLASASDLDLKRS